MRNYFILLGLSGQLLSLQSKAQFADSLHISIGTTATASLKEFPPFWIVSNRFGTISSKKNDLSTHLLITNTHSISKQQITDSTRPVSGSFIQYGFDLYNNNHFENTFFKEGFVKASVSGWELRAGRVAEVVGDVDQQLSSGSLGISGNALPIPKVKIASNRYHNIPYTNGWLQFKASFGHGWLGKTNYLKGAFLHEKSFYLKLGKQKFSAYGGLNHFAQWGGTHPSGKAPSRFKDYLNIVVGAKGNSSDPVYQQGPVDIANAVGNHLIISDAGFVLQQTAATFKLYTQTIFEKGKGRGPNERDRLVALKVFSRDRLVGFSWAKNKNSFFQKLVVEGLFTKYQGGPELYIGQDNYYNNATYRTGWTYRERIIGTPIFLALPDAKNFFPGADTTDYSNYTITSNRVNAIHIGLSGDVSSNIAYRILGTYAEHFGNFNSSFFNPSKKQLNLLLEVSCRLRKDINLSVALGKDAGDLSDNIGGSLKIEWELK